MGTITTGSTPKALQGGAGMTRLSYGERKGMSTSEFALPGRRYPVNDPSHARNALARVSQHGSPAEKARVRAAVHRKFPGIKQAQHNDGGCAHHGRQACAHR